MRMGVIDPAGLSPRRTMGQLERLESARASRTGRSPDFHLAFITRSPLSFLPPFVVHRAVRDPLPQIRKRALAGPRRAAVTN